MCFCWPSRAKLSLLARPSLWFPLEATCSEPSIDMAVRTRGIAWRSHTCLGLGGKCWHHEARLAALGNPHRLLPGRKECGCDVSGIFPDLFRRSAIVWPFLDHRFCVASGLTWHGVWLLQNEPIEKLIDPFRKHAADKGWTVGPVVKFVFDGEVLAPSTTPLSLDCEDDDVIDVHC